MRLASEFGWTYREIDELPMRDVEDIVETLNERAGPAVEHVEPAPSGPITPEEFARMEASMRAFAEADKPRSPWA